MTTPRDALATALDRAMRDAILTAQAAEEPHPVLPAHAAQQELATAVRFLTDALLEDLHAAGWTVARTEHAADGEALAEMVAAVPDRWSWGVFWDRADGAIRAWAEDPYRWDEQPHHISKLAPTIAAAADACREAIEASRGGEG